MKYCSNCGKELQDTDAFCGNCGTKSEIQPAPQPAPQQAPQQAPQPAPQAATQQAPTYMYEQATQQQVPLYQQMPMYEQPTYTEQVYEATPVEAPLSVKEKVLSIIGMVLGIVSLVWAFLTLLLAFAAPILGISYSIVGYMYAIPGMILSSIGGKSGNSKKANIGKVFSLICLILFGVLFILSIIVGAATGFADLDSYSNVYPYV